MQCKRGNCALLNYLTISSLMTPVRSYCHERERARVYLVVNTSIASDYFKGA